MKTFWQFVEAINVPHSSLEISSSSYSTLQTILDKLDKRTIVYFVLHCVEEIEHLLQQSTEAQNCLNLTRNWLKDPDSTIPQVLTTASSSANVSASTGGGTNMPRQRAIYAASFVASATRSAISNGVNAKGRLIGNAITAVFYASDADPNVNPNSRRRKYIHFANSLQASSDIKQPMHQYLQNDADLTAGIAIMLDDLSELEEDLVYSTGNQVCLRMPRVKGQPPVCANNQKELAEIIANDRFY
jgi:hypothetical protein